MKINSKASIALKKKYVQIGFVIFVIAWICLVYYFVLRHELKMLYVLSNDLSTQRQNYDLRARRHQEYQTYMESQIFQNTQESRYFWRNVPYAIAEISQMLSDFEIDENSFTLRKTESIQTESTHGIWQTQILMEGIGDYRNVLDYLESLDENETLIWPETIILRRHLEDKVLLEIDLSFFTRSMYIENIPSTLSPKISNQNPFLDER